MMIEKLGEIETTAIEELVKIKAEQELLESRLEAMEAKKGKVTGEVFDRVRADYGARLADLDRTARPLKEQARREYARLRDLHQQCENGLRAARLDTEELQFRHELGEFEDEEFQQQLEASKGREEERGTELAEAERLTERFVEAFRSREELEEPLEVPVPEPEPPPAEPAELETAPEPPAVLPEADAEMAAEGIEPPGGEAEPSAAELSPDRTAAMPFRLAGGAAPPPPPPPPPAPRPGPPPPVSEEDLDGKTVVSGGARLDLQAEDGTVRGYTLGIAPTTIGRSPDCVICLMSESVSRRHAEVVLDGRGYVVRDLGSNNGTFVNDQRVDEAKLNDGDVVRLGLTYLTFREG